MKEHLTRSRFSTHFNRLAYMGMWSLVLPSSTARSLFLFYRFFCFAFLLSAIVLQMIDLYLVLGNLRKVTYNFCTSIIVIGITVKVLMLYGRRDCLDELRLHLWRDSVALDSPEDVAIQDAAYHHLENMQRLFYAACLIFLPIWIGCSYFSYKWGPRQLAFAGYLPMDDILDDRYYVPALTYQALCGFYVVFLVIEADLSMFSLVLQLEAYYQILCKNILKLNDLYENDDVGGKKLKAGSSKEINACLRKESVQRLLKSFIMRQLEILQYLKNFEYVYSGCLIIQVFAASCLVVMNGLELSMYLQEMSVKLYFQSAYAFFIMVDILFICYHLSRLTTESLKVGAAAYSTVWYRMEPDIRKSLLMIIVRSQTPPRITAGKLFLMDLTTYLHILRNIYSWLMLFRQLGNK